MDCSVVKCNKICTQPNTKTVYANLYERYKRRSMTKDMAELSSQRAPSETLRVVFRTQTKVTTPKRTN